MKTKELIKLVGQLEALYVKDHGDKLGFYEVGSDNPYFILPKLAEEWSDCKTNLRYLRCISKAKLEILLDAGDHIVEYLNTPPAEREEEKRYRVKFPGITRDGRNIYLMRQSNRDGTHGIDWSPEEYIFDDFPDGYLFTEKEIKSINEHYWHFAEEGEEDE